MLQYLLHVWNMWLWREFAVCKQTHKEETFDLKPIISTCC